MKQSLLESINSNLTINERLTKLSTLDIGQLHKEQISCTFRPSSGQFLDTKVTVFMKNKMSSNLLGDSSAGIKDVGALNGERGLSPGGTTNEGFDMPLDWQVPEQRWIYVVNRILSMSNSLRLKDQLRRYDSFY